MSADLAYPSWIKGHNVTLAQTVAEASKAFITLSATEGVDTTLTAQWSYTLMLTAERVEDLEIEAFLLARKRRRRVPAWMRAIATIVVMVSVWTVLTRMGFNT